MLKWFKNLTQNSQPLSPTSLESRIRNLSDDEELEELWDLMDQAPQLALPVAQKIIADKGIAPLPRYSSLIWLAYTQANGGHRPDPHLVDELQDAITWALKFEANNVLIGGALATLDPLDPEEKEHIALNVFAALSEQSARRYWLLLKVRTDAMLAAVTASMRPFEPDERAKLVGAFRQFQHKDIPLLQRHYVPGMPGSDLFEEALKAAGTHSDANKNT